MKRKFSILVVILCCVLILSSCGGGNSLAGKWKQVKGEGTLYFTEDSVAVDGVEYFASDCECSYERSGENVLIINENETLSELSYYFDGKLLNITYKEKTDSYIRVDDADKIESTKEIESSNDESEKPKELTDNEIKASIIGFWVTEYKGSKLVYQFEEGGTGHASLFPMTWTVENGVVTVNVDGFGKTETGSAVYSVSDESLVLTKGEDTLTMKRTTKEELENE